MSGFVGVIVSDPWLQSQLTQVELRSLNSKFVSLKNQSGKVTLDDLPSVLVKVKSLSSAFKEKEITQLLADLGSSDYESDDLDFESFLKIYLNMRDKAADKSGGGHKHSSSFLKASTTTLHTINQSEKGFFVLHINRYLGDDLFLMQFLPLDPDSNDLYELVKDGVLLW